MADDLRNKPKAHDPASESSEVAALRAQVEKLEAILMATIQSQPKVSPDTIWAKQHEKEQAIKADLDRYAALFLETTKNRSQWEANKLNPDGKKLFRVSVGWCPELIIRANDDTTARAYYDKVCGINSVTMNANKPETTTYAIVEVTGDPDAQKLSKSNWQYQAAA